MVRKKYPRVEGVDNAGECNNRLHVNHNPTPMQLTGDSNGVRLWQHQKAAIEATRASITCGDKAGLLSMPTGTGKTVVFCEAARQLGWPTLVLVHRDELVTQTVTTLGKVWPSATVGVIKAGRDEWCDGEQVVVASVQSLHTKRLAEIPRDRFALVVADEAHHSVADSWRAIVDHFAPRYLLGLTATAERLDGRGLDLLFGDRPIYSYPIRQAVKDDILVEPRQWGVIAGESLDGVVTRGGDFVNGQLATTVNTPERNRKVVEAYQKHCVGRRALAFAVDVEHATDLAACFNDAGLVAAALCGKTPLDQRRELLRRFATGEIRVLANCQVLTEGFDDRGVSAILMARPTQSRGLYIQCIGRGLRRAPGKSDCVIVDFVGNCNRHKLVTALDLFGKVDTTNANGESVIDCVDEQIARQEQCHEIKSVTPCQWRLERVCPWPELPSLRGYVVAAAWQSLPATEKQIGYLRRLGLDLQREITKGEACWLLERTLEYQAAYPRPATIKQRGFLKWQHAWTDGISFDEAKRRIGDIKRRAVTA